MKEIICAGFGGQGVLTAGLILANIGIGARKNVTWIPSYGSEMRGGTANCSVKISNELIASPYIKESDVLVVMNVPSLDKFQSFIRKDGYMIVNSSIIQDVNFRKDINIVKIPANEIAKKNLNIRGANLAMLGGLIGSIDLFDKDLCINGINEYFAKKNIKSEKNRIVFEEGYTLAKGGF